MSLISLCSLLHSFKCRPSSESFDISLALTILFGSCFGCFSSFGDAQHLNDFFGKQKNISLFDEQHLLSSFIFASGSLHFIWLGERHFFSFSFRPLFCLSYFYIWAYFECFFLRLQCTITWWTVLPLFPPTPMEVSISYLLLEKRKN